MDVKKIQNDTYLSKIFLSKKYLANTMNNAKERNKRSPDRKEYFWEGDANNDLLISDQIRKMHRKSMPLYRVGHQGIRSKRSNRKQLKAV